MASSLPPARSLTYCGTWNASTNTPVLVSGTGYQGNYYIVSVAGTTMLDGNYGWAAGDHVEFNGSTWSRVPGAGSRIRLTANGTLWVRPFYGSDATGNGLGTSTAFATIQHCFNVIQSQYDLNGFIMFVACDDASGAYPLTATASASAPWVGGGYVMLTGNGMMHWTVNNGDCLQVSNGAYVQIQNFTLSTTGSSGQEINVLAAGIVSVGTNMVLGPCAGAKIQNYGQINLPVTYTSTGNAVAEWHVIDGGHMVANNCNVVLTGTPAYSSYFLGMDNGVLEAINTTFTGSATGKRCYLHYNSSVRFNAVGMEAALTILPGSLAGTVERNATFDDWGKTALRINKKINQTSNFQITLPYWCAILKMEIAEHAGAAVTGGINIGTTVNGNNVVSSFPVSANSWTSCEGAALLLPRISTTQDTTLYVSAVTAWGGASVDLAIFFTNGQTV